MLRNLNSLGDWNVQTTDGNVRAAIEKILSWQHRDGYIRGPISNAFSATHYNGLALRNLIQLEMADDSRTQKLIEWLLSKRSKDGLWCRADRPNPEKDQWISEIAIGILARYADMY